MVVVASLVVCVAPALECVSFSSCDAWAWLLCSMWILPGPGIKLMSPALVGGFLTTGSPGKTR